jgi:hypothetical protein
MPPGASVGLIPANNFNQLNWAPGFVIIENADDRATRAPRQGVEIGAVF